MYEVVIDRSLCSGFGACVELAPEAFALDDGGTGTATARAAALEDVTVREAAAACPMGAITVIERDAP